MVTNRKDIPKHYYTLDEYFALENAGNARFEYWDGDIVCMSGGSQAHTSISDNVHFQLRLKLRGGKCRAFSANQSIKTPALPPYRYPDASVACGDLEFEQIGGIAALINPVLIVEVLSPSTAVHDLDKKFRAYQGIPTFKEYLLISQDSYRVIHYAKRPDGNWTRNEISDAAASLLLDSIDSSLSLADIYEDINFPIT